MPGLPGRGGGLGSREGGQSFFWEGPPLLQERPAGFGTLWVPMRIGLALGAEIRGSKALFLKSPAVLAARWGPWPQGPHLPLISLQE